MTDSKVLIIGGHSGIGMAVSELLNKQRPDIPEMEQYVPDKATLDVESRSTVERVIREEGPFTHIIYSAGLNRLAWVYDRSISFLMEDMFYVNCSGFVGVVSAHVRIWEGAPLSVVAVSSDAARIPMRGSVAYCASKAALEAAVRCMAREMAPVHRINAVAPGMVEGTPMTEYIDRTIPEFRDWSPEYAREYERSGTPTGRRATLAEVAETIVWVLTGPEQMTGAIIDINGGR